MYVYRLFESLIIDNGLSWEVDLEGGGTTMDDPPPVTVPIRWAKEVADEIVGGVFVIMANHFELSLH